MQIYETTIVLDSLKKSEDIVVIVEKMETFIKNHGGTILKKEEWGKKRLAYEINRKQYGTYFHLLLEGPSDLPGLLSIEYRLNETILRHLTVRADKYRIKQLKDEPPEPTQSEAVEAADADEAGDEAPVAEQQAAPPVTGDEDTDDLVSEEEKPDETPPEEPETMKS